MRLGCSSIRFSVKWTLLFGIFLGVLVQCSKEKPKLQSRSARRYRRSRSHSRSQTRRHFYINTTSVKRKNRAAASRAASLLNSSTNSSSSISGEATDDNIADGQLIWPSHVESKRRDLQVVTTAKPTKSLKPTTRPIAEKPAPRRKSTTTRPTTRPITEKPTLNREQTASRKPTTARKSPSNGTTTGGMREPQNLLGNYAVLCRTSKPGKRMKKKKKKMANWDSDTGKGSSKSKIGGSGKGMKKKKKKMKKMKLPLCSEKPTVRPMKMKTMKGPGVPTKKPTAANMAPPISTAMMVPTQRPTTRMTKPTQPAAVMTSPTIAPMTTPAKTPTIKPVPAPGSPTAAPVPSVSTPAPSMPSLSTPAPSVPSGSTPAPSVPSASTPAPSVPSVSTPAPSKPTSPPAPGTGVTASPFELIFEITGGSPSAADFTAAETIVQQFLQNYFNSFFGDLCPMVGFSATQSSTSSNPPVSMGLDVTATFDPNCPVMPTQADVDVLLQTALSPPNVDALIALLNSLPTGNVLSTTSGVTYSAVAKFTAPSQPTPLPASNTTSVTQSAIQVPTEPTPVSPSELTKNMSNITSSNISIPPVEPATNNKQAPVVPSVASSPSPVRSTPTKSTITTAPVTEKPAKVLPAALSDLYLVDSKPMLETPSIPSIVSTPPRPGDIEPKPIQTTASVQDESIPSSVESKPTENTV